MANGRRGHAKKIDVVHWTYGSFNATAFAAGTVAANVFPAQHLSETLLRTRGEWIVGIDAGQAPGIVVSVAVGLILVPEGTGTTVLWSPITDGDAPWLWWDTMNLRYEELVTDVIQPSEQSGGRRVIDSKAMRKVRNREIQFVAENATVETLGSVNITGAVRVLSGS